jgi:hypothetical protein
MPLSTLEIEESETGTSAADEALGVDAHKFRGTP